MKKSLFLLLLSVVCSLSLNAQKFQGDYFAIALPNSNWGAEEIAMPEGGQALSVYILDGDNVDRAAVITAIPGHVDMAQYMDLQKNSGNEIFKGAKFFGVDEGEFRGYDALNEDFTCNFNGSPTGGSVIVFTTEASTYYILLYSTDPDADFVTLMDTFVIKK